MADTAVEASVVPEPSADDKAYAGLAHALMISTWWIGPLIIYLTKKESRFVSFHSLQALFWQIIFTLLYFLGMIGWFAAMIPTMLKASQAHPPNQMPFPTAFFVVFPLVWLLMMGGFAISMTLGIVYCLKAMRGQWAEYPLIGKWVRRISRSVK
jgi:uncharacterized Tic20 family protein